jgi:hypothetical protein
MRIGVCLPGRELQNELEAIHGFAQLLEAPTSDSNLDSNGGGRPEAR